MQVTATAPGKLVLLGEYAVLEGAPALVTAVDRRAQVTVKRADSWRITAPQIEIHDLALAADGAVPSGLAKREQKALAIYAAVREAVIAETASRKAGGRLPPLSIHIDTGAFYRDGSKLGLGSSAAVAVALTAAMAAVGGLETDDAATMFRLASEAHRHAQGGLGSSADVAASTYGGVLIYRRGQTPKLIHLPQDLFLLPVCTGISASTRRLVETVYRLRLKDSVRFEACIQKLADLAEKGADKLTSGTAAAFEKLTDAYYEGLCDLGEAADADIVSAAHRQLHEIVHQAGGSYKPSGAGGGDFGLAVVADPVRLAAVAEAIAEAGLCAIDLSLAASGMIVSRKQ